MPGRVDQAPGVGGRRSREGGAHGELRRAIPARPRRDVRIAAVIRTGEPDLIEDIPAEALADIAQDEEQLRVLESVGFASHMVVPLRARGRILGAIAMVSAESGRRFDLEDLELAQELADRCALAVDNARLYADRA